MRSKIKYAVVGLILLCIVTGIILKVFFLGDDDKTYYNEDGSFRHVTAKSAFSYVENHPAFSQFSSFIQPWKDKANLAVTPYLSLQTVCNTNHVSVDSIVDGFNFVIDESSKQNIYYDFYTEEERAADSSKEETGLIFIPGEKDAPFAFVSAGGAFKSVGLFLEAFPVAKELHEKGYNVFMLKYRVNPEAGTDKSDMDAQEIYANEDYGRAMQFIRDNQSMLGVTMKDYSVWGFSAGGRLTNLWGLDNDYGYEHYGIEKPAAMMLIYSGWFDENFAGQYDTEPPTYFAYLENDDVIGIENINGIKTYIEELNRLNILTDVHVYQEARHGFGEGRGTDAEGWIKDAVSFWKSVTES